MGLFSLVSNVASAAKKSTGLFSDTIKKSLQSIEAGGVQESGKIDPALEKELYKRSITDISGKAIVTPQAVKAKAVDTQAGKYPITGLEKDTTVLRPGPTRKLSEISKISPQEKIKFSFSEPEKISQTTLAKQTIEKQVEAGEARTTFMESDPVQKAKTAAKFLATIPQAVPRAITSVGGEAAAGVVSLIKNKNVEFEYTPKNTFEKMVFGDEPIKGVFKRVEDAEPIISSVLQKAGFDKDIAKGQSLILAPLFIAGMTALDLSPFGGEENVAKKIALSKDAGKIAEWLKPMLKEHTDDEIKVIAEKFVNVKNAKQVHEDILKHISDDNYKTLLKASKTSEQELGVLGEVLKEEQPKDVLYHGSDQGKMKVDEYGNVNLTNDAEAAKNFGEDTKVVDKSKLKIYEAKDKAEMFDITGNPELRQKYIDQGIDTINAENHAIVINPKVLEDMGMELRTSPMLKTIGEVEKSIDPLIEEAKKYKTAEEFVDAQFKKPISYGMTHRPTVTNATADNITQEVSDMGFPKDFYSHPEYYENVSNKSVKESLAVLKKIKGNPDAEVTIYRASPKNELNTGDWVTLSKEYAKGESLAEGSKINSFKVKAKDIQFAGDSINEFGYYPKSQLTDIWKKAREEASVVGQSLQDIKGIAEGESSYYSKVAESQKTGEQTGDLSKDYSTSPLKLKFKKDGSVKFRGEKIESPADIAFAFQELRNNATESFYVVAMKGDRPIAVELQTMGTIDESLVTPFDVAPILKEKKADGLYLVHNHPSGNPNPSEEDINITLRMRRLADNMGAEIKGHVIVDGEKFGNIDKYGETDVLDIIKGESGKTKEVPKYKKFIEWNDSTDGRITINGPEDISNMVKGMSINWEKNSIITFADTQLKVLSTKVVSNKKIATKMIGGMATTGRAKNIFISNSSMSVNEFRHLKSTLKSTYDVELLDAISFTKDGKYSSLDRAGSLREPAQKMITKEKSAEDMLKLSKNVTPEEYTAARQLKKRKLDEFFKSEEGAAVLAKQEVDAQKLVNYNEDVAKAIKNTSYYKKEKDIKDIMGEGWLMRRKADNKSIISTKTDVDSLILKGYEKSIEIDSLAKEAGYDNGYDYLVDQLEMSQKTNQKVLKEAEEYLKKTDKEFGKATKQISTVKTALKGEKITAEKAFLMAGEYTTAREKRDKIKIIQEYFSIPDKEMSKILKKDFRYMDEKEFAGYLEDIRQKSFELSDNIQARNELLTTIRDKSLKNTENLQKVMKLPAIKDMTTEQLQQFNKALEPYMVNDMFLSERLLETVENTELKGLKTYREVKETMARKLGTTVEELSQIKVGLLDRGLYDTALARKNPFYNFMVDQFNKYEMQSIKIVLEKKKTLNELVTAARKSRKRTIIEKLVPTDQRVFEYIESGIKPVLAKEMTKEELNLAHFLISEFERMRDILVQKKTLEKFRENYILHTQRPFLEALKDDGVKTSFKEMFSKNQFQEAYFNIIDDTGNILPMEKFFKYSLRRTGELTPSKNVATAYLTYLQAFEKKNSLDAVIPEIMAYAQVLTPLKETPHGLEQDATLKNFVKQWLNNKKGRTSKLLLSQGDRLDNAVNSLNMFITLRDLGFGLFQGVTSKIGENVMTATQLGYKDYLLGKARAFTKKGREISERYPQFVGENPWLDLVQDTSKNIGDKAIESAFILFRDSTYQSNKNFLLGSLTKEEFNSGMISPERLANLRKEMGRYRNVEGAKSIWGSTTEGKTFLKYREWAVPALTTTVDNLKVVAREAARGNFAKKEVQELARVAITTASAYLMISVAMKDKDTSFLGKMLTKAQRESTSILSAMDPTTWTKSARLVTFLNDLAISLKDIALLEKYKTKSGLKGVNEFVKLVKPTIVSQFQKATSAPAKKALNIPGLGDVTEKPFRLGF